MGTGLRAAFGALYPDGSVYLATSTMIEVARSNLVSVGVRPRGAGST